MKNQALYQVLLEALEVKNFSATDIKKFEEKWHSVTNADPQPCPFCYLADGKIARLIPLNEENGYEPVKCSDCKEIFAIPTP